MKLIILILFPFFCQAQTSYDKQQDTKINAGLSRLTSAEASIASLKAAVSVLQAQTTSLQLQVNELKIQDTIKFDKSQFIVVPVNAKRNDVSIINYQTYFEAQILEIQKVLSEIKSAIWFEQH
jgi:hypothetical protein